MSYERPGSERDLQDGGMVRESVRHSDAILTDSVEVKNRVQFGPIVAGILTAIATMLILTVLGVAIGSSAFEPRDSGETIGTAASIWGVISALIAFFLGGWVAARTAAVAGSGSGLINGLMVGAGVLVLVLWLAGSGVSGLVGTLGSNVEDITNLAEEQGINVDAVQADAEQQASQVDPNQAFETVKDGAWWTLLGLILPLVAAGAGGLAGHNERRDVIQPGR
jgi:hypothetical protein